MVRKPPAGLVERPEDLFRRTTRDAAFFVSFIRPQHIIQFCTCVLIIGLHLILLSGSYLERFEYVFLDYFFRQRPVVRTHPALVYIEIAEDSLQAIGRWPWPRHYHAALTHILTQWKAKAIVFDMLFSEPGTPFDDGALQEAFQESKRVYLPVVLEQKDKAKMWIHSLPELEKYAEGIGHINIHPDRDGAIRRIEPFLKYGNESYPHLAFRVASDYLGGSEKISFPAAADGDLLINWAGKWRNTFEHYSYVDLIKSFEAVQNGKEPMISPKQIEGKICLIGLTALGHADIKANPIEASYPALGVHSNVINSILTKQFIYPASQRVNVICLIAIGLAASFLFVLFRSVTSLIAGLSMGVVWILVGFLLFWQKGIWLYVMHPIALILSLYVFSTAFVLIVRNKERLQLFRLATRDGLTGLYVIRHFRVLLNQVVHEVRQRKRPLSLILGDIDHFKVINDTYGHMAGDMVLKKVAAIVQSHVRSKRPSNQVDFVARYGGEEFIVMLRNAKLSDATYKVAERIRKAVEEASFEWEGKKILVTISLGVASLQPDETVADLMVHRADEALYRAKEGGRNRTCIEMIEKK